MNAPVTVQLPAFLLGGRHAPGRPPSQVEHSYIRDLEPADIVEIAQAPSQTIVPLKTLRAAHHNIARLLAAGESVVVVSRITGRTVARIWQLKQDPAFQELIAYYSSQVEEVFTDTLEQMKDVGATALDVIQERLEESPDQIPTKDLTAIAKLTLDRTGHGPSKTLKVLNASSILKQLKEAKEAEGRGKVLDRERTV